jgi:hypothetical protein
MHKWEEEKNCLKIHINANKGLALEMEHNLLNVNKLRIEVLKSGWPKYKTCQIYHPFFFYN